ncbi:serine hydrolase [Amycolatopsis kentuckyensis]|uniref:serine hydrolase n=1 Tax=Amycolatopsis kentuckyensis TaxID=218823 RepID=UPI000A391394|nr:serine hydrolase [Amycolatopsis kentuckyensis]
MLERLNNVKLLVGIAVVIVVGGLLIAVAVNSDSGSDSWRARCNSAPAGPADKQASLVAEARKALLSTGNDPRLGIEIVDLGACAVETRWKADQPQPAASVVKLLIALDLLDRSGVPSGSEATAVHSMLAASDDRVASRLWQQNGGPDIVRRQAGKLGLAHTTPPADAGQWGSTRMSPTDVVTVYRHITAGLSEDERAFVTGAMENAPRAAVDGFDQHFGIPRAFPGAAWAVKQGWGSSEGRRVLNTTGLVRTATGTYAVAVMASWSDTIDWPAATTAVTTAVGSLKGSLKAGKA